MLLELRAENYAVIDHATAALGPGLNLLTGETGAGKSILVDALALLLGGKASSEVVRHGAERAVVSCVFEATDEAARILEAHGIDAGDGEILLRREIAASGKGRVFVNSQPATAAVLKLLAPELALIHAQSETLAGFDPTQQRLLLDRFAGISIEVVHAAYVAWRARADKLQSLESDEQERLRMADLWRFQSREIESAALRDGEDGQLETEKRVLNNAEKLYAAAMSAYEQLYDGNNAAEASLRVAERHLEELARYEPRFGDAAQQLASARATVEDVAETVRGFGEGIQGSPERLAEIEDRLALVDRLKRKYGASVAEVIAYGQEVAARLNEIENRDAVLADLRKQLADAAAEYRSEAEVLTAARTAAAKKLAGMAEQQINDLAMKARFAVEVQAQRDEADWSAHGWDAIACRIATNPGEPLKALDQIASGGEMSRVLLALKVSVEEGAARAGKGKRKTLLPRTLVFDEIDIGIGGRAAEAVGQKLKVLSRSQQVLCVTHLPQIAAFATQHFVVEKREEKGRTRTAVRSLEPSERVEEVARMLSGAKKSETSLRHAEQMLAEAAGV
ncbi:MAG: repair protein RecN [Acidobacteriaceae bacterium]|jgi:DNA repair protein RecN (Recombination protein N)|nr:repair protein RecN [Acidobacteriaceae bacterium]